MEILGYSRSQEHKVIYKWEIDKIISFIESTKDDGETVQLKSSQFTTNGKTKNSWYLELQLLREQGWMSLFLRENNGKEKVRIGFSLFLLDKTNERKFSHTFYKNENLNNGRGSINFVEIKQLLEKKNDLLPNNILTVGVELTVYDGYESFTTDYPLKKRQRKITDDLKELYDSKINSDAIFVVGNKKLLAHKLILSTRSPVFSSMFTHKMKENEDSEVAIPDIDPEIFNKMLEFIYIDEINDLDADAKYLLEAADKYQLLNLKSLCEESLSKSASIDNAIELLILADLHNANQLLESIFEFMPQKILGISEALTESTRLMRGQDWSGLTG